MVYRSPRLITAALLALATAFLLTPWSAPAQGQKKDEPKLSRGKEVLKIQAKLGASGKMDVVQDNAWAEFYKLKVNPLSVYTVELESKEFPTTVRVLKAKGEDLTSVLMRSEDQYREGPPRFSKSTLRFLPSDLGVKKAQTLRILVTSDGMNAKGAFTLKVYELVSS